MALRSIGANIRLSGEAEWNASMKSINSNLRLLSSNMKMSESDFAGMANSQTALANKGKILEDMIGNQKEKVQLLEQALKKASAAHGENSEEANRLQIQLNNANIELNEMRRELDANSALLEEASASADGCAASIDEFGNTVREAGESSEEFGDSASNSFMQTADALASSQLLQKVSELAKSLVDLSTGAAAFADNILTLSTTTGVSTESLQEFQYASELVDVSVDTYATALKKCTKSMDDARDGTEDTAEAYKRLGVEITNADGTLRDNEDVFWESIDALGAVGNETERDALCMELFGKSATDLNPLIEAGSGRMLELADAAHEAGYVMSEETLASLGALDDSLQILSKNAEAAKNAIGASMAPMLTSLADAASNALENITAFAEKNPELIAAIETGIGTFGAAATALLGVTTAIKGFNAIVGTLNSTFSGISVTVGGLASTLGLVSVLLAAVAYDYATITGMQNEADEYYSTHLAETTAEYEKAVADLEAARNGENSSGLTLDAEAQEAYIGNLEKRVSYLGEMMELAEANANVETESNEAIQVSIEDTTEKVTELMAAYQEAWQAAYESARGQTDVFETLATEVTLSVDDMLAALGSQEEYWNNYAANLQGIKDAGLIDGLVEQLSDGSVESAGYLQAIMDQYNQLIQIGDTEGATALVESLNSAFTASEESMAAYADAVAGSSADVAAKIGEVASEVADAAKECDVSSEMAEAANNSIQGFVNGLDSGPIVARMQELAAEASEAFRAELDINSPSRVFARIGGEVIEGFNKGIDDNTSLVEQKMEGLSGAVASSFAPTITADDLSGPAASGSSGVTVNVYTQEMTEDQTDYLITQVNKRLGAGI